MSVETQTMPADHGSTGSASLDRVLAYPAVKKGTEMAEGIVSKSPILSGYVAPAAQKGLSVSINAAARVPGVTTVACKVDAIGDRTLQKLEDVTSSSEEKLTKYVKETLPLDRDGKDDGDDGLSVSGVKERVIVNGKKVVGKVVPESVQTVAGKSAAVAGSAMGALSTAYNGMTKENLKNTYNKCTVENAKKVTKGAYNECTAENAKKVALVTKAVVDGSIATTKAVVGGTVAATKTTVKVASKTIDTTVKVAGKTIDTTVKVAGKTIDTAVKAKNYAVGARAPDVDAPEAEPETPVAEVD